MKMENVKKVLHVGCGKLTKDSLPEIYKDYDEVRLDIDPEVRPHFCCSITKMDLVKDDKYDSVYSQHNLEHLHPFDIIIALTEMKRVLNDNGFVFIKVPDIEIVAEYILKGQINNTVYESPAGPITPLDMIYGYKYFTHKNPFMAHQCAFTLDSLICALKKAGFTQVTGRRIGFDLEVIGTKTDKININEILEKI